MPKPINAALNLSFGRSRARRWGERMDGLAMEARKPNGRRG